MHVARAPHVVQPVPKPFAGFCQEAFMFDCTERSRQPHCPCGMRFWFAWTATQYVPGPSETSVPSGMEKLGPFVYAWFGRDSSSEPGRLLPPFE